MTAMRSGTDWRSMAACMSADPELFFPISATGPAVYQVAEAKAVCAGCQVKRECLDFALATGEVHGVWGGLTDDERRHLRRGSTARPLSPAAQHLVRPRPRPRSRPQGQRQQGQRQPGQRQPGPRQVGQRPASR
jgi:WhiB family redox-sensing transcriptional regulator